MIKLISAIFLSFVTSGFSYSQNSDPFAAPKRGFTSWLPAPSWDNALLTGNGIMGAMVMGQPHDETIILNQAELYMPVFSPMKPIDQVSRLAEIRQLIFEGKYAEAGQIPTDIAMKEGYGGLRWTDPYIPAFDVRVVMAASNLKRYKRMVDFATAETKVVWEDGNGLFEKKLFVSRADNVIVLSIKGIGKINCQLGFDRHLIDWQQWTYINENFRETSWSAKGNHLVYRSEFKKRWEGSLQGFEGVGRIVNRGGQISVEGNQVVIKDADEVLMLVRIEPSYDYSNSKVESIEKALDAIPTEYVNLLANHVKLHGDLFNRTKLNLGGSVEDANLDAETMNLKAKEKVSNGMIEKQFDAARYNIICSTGINPPNLQGIWNANWTPPWSSDYTQDGNLQVAVSSMLSANMPELLLPLFNYEDKFKQAFRDNAKNLYGCRGIQIPSRTSTIGWNIHFNPPWTMTFWNAGAGWISNYYYDYWLYTGDKKFLADRAYPFMKEAALFYEDFLMIGKDGRYVFNPSYSPENNSKGSNSQVCINATMDVAVAKQLLRNCIEAAKTLGENKKQISKWKTMLSKMPSYEVNQDGSFREWLWPGLDDNYAHRHVSHLYGLFDRIDPEIASDPKLIAGCKKAIEERMKIRRQDSGGEMVFGMVNLAWAASKMGEGVMVGDMVNWMSAHYWSNSLATYHNPGNLFNMDLSGGFPSVIISALTYSEPGFISLLPALPSSWDHGKIEGVSLRGQIKIKSLSWEGKQINVVLKSAVTQKVRLKVPGEVQTITGNHWGKIEKKKLNPAQYFLILPEKKEVTLEVMLK